MTTIPEINPWIPNMFPTAAANPAKSADRPSGAELRPFGLTGLVELDERELADPDQPHYDPARQLNVSPEGTTSAEHLLRAATRQDTRYDSQWFVDRD
ncbi:hypothetical protein CDG81_11225 [Actinopolyspora erythraea]|uniref:ATP-grasp-modified RiPP n=1 Tax=Actinopolyspora erythraea TaxID=414996 RepID=A0A099D836_9ACTN|nr:hypothetical protein [Actinopolyspora erythraea]ASU78753.1 hypothetical protein CDG81_11225 [Actinopolyspora erythraea]KGI81510.1 hypothetical protein IL38_11280 [Actinopolyspora erythraea]